jgi:hypothetical protein
MPVTSVTGSSAVVTIRLNARVVREQARASIFVHRRTLLEVTARSIVEQVEMQPKRHFPRRLERERLRPERLPRVQTKRTNQGFGFRGRDAHDDRVSIIASR